MDLKRFPKLITSIYRAVDKLEAMFPGRHFTPDGHMLGSIGEALAAYHYRLTLSQASAKCHDGACKGRLVQIKATQRSRIAISSQPEHLLVLRLKRDGSFTEAYNGPGSPVWKLVATKPMPKNGQHQVSLSALKALMKDVPTKQTIPRRRAASKISPKLK